MLNRWRRLRIRTPAQAAQCTAGRSEGVCVPGGRLCVCRGGGGGSTFDAESNYQEYKSGCGCTQSAPLKVQESFFFLTS